jgi:hypothetical protein
MAGHEIEVTFKVESAAGCSDTNIGRDWWIIQRMALALCQPGTTANAIPPMILYEAQRTYLMMVALRLALEEEVKANTKFSEVS